MILKVEKSHYLLSANCRTRKADGGSPSQSSKAQDPGPLMPENRRKWMFQVYQRATKPSLHVFCSVRVMSNRFDDALLCWQACSLRSQMLISFRSTCTDTPRNNILPPVWVSIPQPSQTDIKLSMTPTLGYLEMSSILFLLLFSLSKCHSIVHLQVSPAFFLIPFLSNSQVKELTSISWMTLGPS